MLAQLKTVVLIKAASAFLGSIAGSKWPETKNFLLKLLVLRNEGYSMREIAKKLKIS